MRHPEDNLVTIVLLLKDRPEYTVRWLEYVSRMDFPFKILVADGSSGNQAETLLSKHGSFPGLNIDYVRYAPDACRTDFYAKTTDAIRKATTPYIIKAANDDFFSVDGIRKSVAFLEAHSEYAAARGGIADFSLDPRGVPDAEQFIFGRIDNWEAFKAGEKSNAHPRAGERVAAQCSFYVTCWHDVIRTRSAATHEASLLECNPVDARVADHVTDFLTVASGPIYRGNYLYMFRQSNSRNSEGRALIDQFKSQADWLNSPWWKRDTDNLFSVVAKEIGARDGGSIESARAKFEAEYIGIYLAELLDRDSEVSLSLSFRYKRLLRRVADDLPIVGGLRRHLALLAARRRARRASKAIGALGWDQEAQPVIRFLAAGLEQ